MYLLVIKQLVTMSFIVVAGFMFAKAFKVGEREQKFLSKLLLYFVNPCLVLSSFNLEFDFLKLKQLLFMACVSIVLHGIMILIGYVCVHSKNPSQESYDKLDRIGVVFTNCGFVGIPLIRGVFGDEGVFFLMGYLVIFNVFLWTYGYYILSGTISIRKIVLNPNIICVCLGILIFCMPFTLPSFIAKPVSMIGDVNTAVSMILIGIMFADFKMPEVHEISTSVYIGRVVRFSFLRLVLCALVNMAVLFVVYRLFHKIPDSRMMLFVALICSMCPAATSVPSLACVFDKDTSYASLLVCTTSLLCMITVPSFVAIADFLLKNG